MGDRNRKRRGSITHPIHSSSSSEEKQPASHYKNYQRRIRRSYSAPHSSRGRSTNLSKSRHTTSCSNRRRSFTNQLSERGRWHNFLEEFVPPVPHRFDTDESRAVRFTASATSGGGGADGNNVRCPSKRVNRRMNRGQNNRSNNSNSIPNRNNRVPRQKLRQRVSWSGSDRLRVYAADVSSSSSSSSSSDSSSSDSSSSSTSSTTSEQNSKINQLGILTAAAMLGGQQRSSSVPPNFYRNLGDLVRAQEEISRRQQAHGHGEEGTIHSYYSQYQRRSRSYQYGDLRTTPNNKDKDNRNLLAGTSRSSRSIHPLAFFAEFLGEDLPPPPPPHWSQSQGGPGHRNQSQGSVDVQSVMSSLGSYAEFLPEGLEQVGNEELSSSSSEVVRKNDSLEYSSSESSLSLVQRSFTEEENQQQQHLSTMEEEEQQQQTINQEHQHSFEADEYPSPKQSTVDEELQQQHHQQQQQQHQQQQFDTLMLLTRSTSPLTTIAEDSLETASTTSASSAPPLTTNAIASVKQTSSPPVEGGSSRITDTSGLNKVATAEKKKKGNAPVNKAVKRVGGNHPNAVDTVFPSKRAYSRGSGSKGIKFRERFMYNWDDGLYDNIAIREGASPIPLCAADVAAGVAATSPTLSPPNSPSRIQDNCTASSSSVEVYKRTETGSSLKTASTADSTVFSGMPAYSRHNSTTSQASAYTFSSMKSYLTQSQIRSLEDAPAELVDVLNQQLSILKTRRQDILAKAKLRKSIRKMNLDDSIRMENSIQFSLFVMKDKVEQLQDILGPLNMDVPDATAESVFSDTSGSADSTICDH